jgi:hypothetical protein
MFHRITRSVWTIFVTLGCIATAIRAQEPTAEVILSENAASTVGLASVLGGGVYVTWSESVPVGAPPRNVLLARRLDANLATRLAFRIADDRTGPETYFQCPVVARIGADRLAFAWMAATVAGRRLAYRVTTAAGVPVGPVRFAEEATPDRDAFCPQIGGWARGFAIAWPSGPKVGPQISFRARSFDENGRPVSPRLLMQPEARAAGFPPGIAVDARGHFTVSWSVFSPAGGRPARLKMRRFLKNGIPTAGTVEVAGDATESAALATFGHGAEEGVEIAWRNAGTVSPGSVWVQRFDRQLRPQGAARVVANSGFFGLSALRVDAAGRSAIVWGLNGPQTRGLFFDEDLAPCSPPFPVQHGRAVSAVGLAFSSPEEAAFALLEEGAYRVRRLVVRTFSLAECPSLAK